MRLYLLSSVVAGKGSATLRSTCPHNAMLWFPPSPYDYGLSRTTVRSLLGTQGLLRPRST